MISSIVSIPSLLVGGVTTQSHSHFIQFKCIKYDWSYVPQTKNFPVLAQCGTVFRSKRRGEKKTPTSPEHVVRLIVKCSEEGVATLAKLLEKHSRLVQLEECFLLFDIFGRKDKWLEALEVFRWMQQQHWYHVDTGVYSKLISIMGKKGQIRLAMWLFAEMRKSGCRPDTSVYNAVIQAHLHTKDKEKALAKAFGYLEKMKEKEMEQELGRMKNDKCKPDIITFNLLIDAYGRRQEFSKMEQVFTSLLRSKEEPSLPTFNSMITNYGKARRIEKVESVYKKMTSLGYEPSHVTYECLILAYGHCGNVTKAREIFSEMIDTNIKLSISTLHALLEVYCNNRLFDEADILFCNASSMGIEPQTSTYKLLYKAYTRAKETHLVEKLLKSMNAKGIMPNKKFFLDALGSYTSSQLKDKKNEVSNDSGPQVVDNHGRQV